MFASNFVIALQSVTQMKIKTQPLHVTYSEEPSFLRKQTRTVVTSLGLLYRNNLLFWISWGHKHFNTWIRYLRFDIYSLKWPISWLRWEHNTKKAAKYGWGVGVLQLAAMAAVHAGGEWAETDLSWRGRVGWDGGEWVCQKRADVQLKLPREQVCSFGKAVH